VFYVYLWWFYAKFSSSIYVQWLVGFIVFVGFVVFIEFVEFVEFVEFEFYGYWVLLTLRHLDHSS